MTMKKIPKEPEIKGSVDTARWYASITRWEKWCAKYQPERWQRLKGINLIAPDKLKQAHVKRSAPKLCACGRPVSEKARTLCDDCRYEG